MAAEVLTKSYVNTHDPDDPVQENLVMYKLFEKARDEGVNGEIYNLETKERTSTLQILAKADEYAKGLLSLGLIPGEDTLAVVGCTSAQSYYLFTACCSIGIGYASPYIFKPHEESIVGTVSKTEAKVVVVGEGKAGDVLPDFLKLFSESDDKPECSRLPCVKHVFYDNTYKDRKPEYKFMKMIGELADMGADVLNEILRKAKDGVRPEYVLHHLFTSGSTGEPKCVAHTNKALANELLQLRVDNVEPVIAMGTNTDDMIGFACIAWALAGKISKTVLILDYSEQLKADELAENLVQGIIDEGVQHLVLPGTIQSVISKYIVANNINFPAMKLFINGAQIISRGFKEQLTQVFQGIPFTAYGMTETFMLAFTTLGQNGSEEEARLEARLYPKRNIELRIADDENKVVDIGVDGEIQVKAYSLMKEYRGMKEKTKAFYTEDGFAKTGDRGVMFTDGRFIIKGRSADAIRFKIIGDVMYPGPIEEAMSTHPAIADISVVSATCTDAYGDEIVYCIRLQPGFSQPSEDELISHGENAKLDLAQRPCRIIYLEKFPSTANARKVSKALLREKVSSMINEDEAVGLCRWYREFMSDFTNVAW